MRNHRRPRRSEARSLSVGARPDAKYAHAYATAQPGGALWEIPLLYGSGLRLMACARLRVKDLDFAYHQLTVRDGKGEKDRVTILSTTLVAPLEAQLRAARHLHAADRELGYGAMYLPHALERKYPNAATDWRWQYVFPAEQRTVDPRSGQIRRHHISEDSLQRAVKRAIQQAGITKTGRCHTLHR